MARDGIELTRAFNYARGCERPQRALERTSQSHRAGRGFERTAVRHRQEGSELKGHRDYGGNGITNGETGKRRRTGAEPTGGARTRAAVMTRKATNTSPPSDSDPACVCGLSCHHAAFGGPSASVTRVTRSPVRLRFAVPPFVIPFSPISSRSPPSPSSRRRSVPSCRLSPASTHQRGRTP